MLINVSSKRFGRGRIPKSSPMNGKALALMSFLATSWKGPEVGRSHSTNNSSTAVNDAFRGGSAGRVLQIQVPFNRWILRRPRRNACAFRKGCVCVCVLRGVNPGIHKEPFGFAFIAFRFVASRGAYPRAAHVCCKRSGHSDMRISRADGECLVATCLSSVSRPGCLGVSLSVQ